MNKLIEELIKKGMGNLMDRSRDALAWADETYLNDRRDEHELERQYENLDLTKEQRKLINDYIACTLSSNHNCPLDWRHIGAALADEYPADSWVYENLGLCNFTDMER